MSSDNLEERQKAFKRFVDSQPILEMLERLSKAGRASFKSNNAWESCLCAMILRLEPNCKIHRILEALPYDQTKPLDGADVLNTMVHLGYFCRKANAKLEEIDERLLPGVFIPENGMPCIVLARDISGKLQFFDPVSKMISSVPPSFDGEGSVWFFQKYDENRSPMSQFMRKGSGHSWFRALLGRFKGTFAQIMTAGFILNIIALVTPLFIMLVYDRVISAGAINTLPMITVGALIAIGFEWKLRQIRSRGLSWLAGRLDNIVSNKIFAHLTGLTPDLIEKASVTAQIARIKTFESVRDFFSGSVFLSLLEAPFVVLSVIAIAFLAGPLVFVPLGMVFLYLMLFYFIRNRVKIVIRIAAKASSARQQFTIETFEKIEGIRSQALTQKWQNKFRHVIGREMMAHFHLSWLGQVSETLAHGITLIAAVATIGFGTHLIWAGEMSAGALVATMILVWRVLTPFYSLCTMVPRLEQLRNSIHQVNKLMDVETEAEQARAFSKLPRIRGQIEFTNVAFRYTDDGNDVLMGLNMEAKPGDLVAITGVNGSGKATILKLIKALHRPSNGSVAIDGFDIRQLSAPDLRRQISYVPKRPDFFEGSVIDNLRLANPLASLEEVKAALDLADASVDVEKLEHGLDTIIGSYKHDQITVSLGTRLSLARAYLNPSSILLIDELPNTLLSGRAGQNLKEYLIRAKGKRTVLICTYREDFMKLSDTIVWLDGFSSSLVGPRAKILNQINSTTGGLSQYDRRDTKIS